MPPKRKVAAAKAVKEDAAAENGAGGDAPTARKGKAKDVDEVPKEAKTRKTRAAKPVVDESDDEEKPKETKPKARKGKGTAAPAAVVEEEPKPKRGRAAPKVKEDSEEEEEDEDEKPKKETKKPKKKGTKEAKADAKPKRGRAAKAEVKEDSDEEEKPEVVEDTEVKPKKTRGKSADAKPEATLQNQTSTDYSKINFTCSTKNPNGDAANFKIASWNVDGLRAWLKKDGLAYIENENPDIMCLQETKCSDEKLPEEITSLEGYKSYFCSSEKEGYAGVAVLSKQEPLSVEYGIDDDGQDKEGRCITAEYENFYLVNVYVPNAGSKLVTLPKRLEWNTLFKDYIKKLDEKKPVIVCGDMNVAHSEIDLSNPKANMRNAGFSKEEREGMTEFLDDGYVDTFRELYPDKASVYTFWTYMRKSRASNVGWRLDYFIISQRLLPNLCDNVVRTDVFGSDHCPITLFLNV